MKIAYLAAVFPSLSETFIYREVQALERRGFEIVKYSLWRPAESTLSAEAAGFLDSTFYLRPFRPRLILGANLRIFCSAPIRYVGAVLSMFLAEGLSPRDRWRSLLHFAEGVVLALRMRDDAIGHIHAHFASQPASVARAIHLLTGISYSISAHAHDIWHDRLMLKQKVAEAEFVACCSDFGRKFLLKECGGEHAGKVRLVYHGLNLRSFPLPPPDGRRDRNMILSVGRLTEQKGFPDLIAACALLKSRGISFHCAIIGQGELRGELESLIRRQGLEPCVELVGAIPQERIREFYHRAWVFCLPCVDTKEGNRDGIPNVLMEAMASGVPVITTTNSGQAELITHGEDGILVREGAPDQLAEAIQMLCTDDLLRESIVRKGRARMEMSFDAERTIESLVELLAGCRG